MKTKMIWTNPKRFTTKTNPTSKKLIIVLGPTAVGKSDFAVQKAREAASVIVNCDSRQIFKELDIGVARPTARQMEAVPHYFVATHSIHDNYTAGKFELEALALLDSLFSEHDTVVMCGGSGLYIDALCKGLDDFPEADATLRADLMQKLETEGIESLRNDLRVLDPDSYFSIDIANRQRIVRALEVTIAAGRPFSSFKSAQAKERPFAIEKIGLTRPREELYDRIDRRVESMMESGLEHEARSLYQFRTLPALNTVGYKELFGYFDGKYDLAEAVRLIKRNTRHYAKRQMTWWRRDGSIEWIPAQTPLIAEF